MKKQLLALSFALAGAGLFAQTPRLSLYEEFTGETCGPCAATNPGLNTLLDQPANLAKMVAIKWQVPIPSAPTNTWSLYQTNKTEINWRANNYGYAVNSAPSGRIDGQSAVVFGATSDHPAYMSNAIITTAQSYTSAFSVTMTRAWDPTYSAVNVTVNIQATAPFTASGNLVFRTVMVERLIQFATQPGTNGETTFENAVRKSFPTIQNGVAMASTWTVGQTQTFTLNCPLPSYIVDKSEVAMVGFIQDDGNRKVAQAVMADKDPFPNDAKAISATPGNYFNCGSSVSPVMVIKNNGSNAITAMTITPVIDGNLASITTPWTGNLAVGATTTVTLNTFTTGVAGGHSCVLNISSVSGTDNNVSNNTASADFYVAPNYAPGANVAEGFAGPAFPPAQWGIENDNGGTTWAQNNSVGGYANTFNSAKYDFYDNNVIGDKDDLLLPPMNLAGSQTPTLTFDVAYCQYTLTGANANDKLEVLVSDDCGVTWTSVYSKAGALLSTTGTTSGSAFLPNLNQWRTDTVQLTGFNLATMLVKFRATSSFGNNLYLDNINLRQEDPVGIATVKNSNVSLELYPNPSNGETTLSINSNRSVDAKISITNILGQTVYNKSVGLSSGSNKVQLNVADFAAGVYNVTIVSNNGTTVKKLNVTK